MANFLFLTWNGGGTTVPVIAIAQELIRRGHSARVLGHEAQTEQFARAGVPFKPYARAGGFEVTASPANLLALVNDRAAALDATEELEDDPVDLVVGEPLLLSALNAVRRRGQRYALLESTPDTLMRVRLRRFGIPLGLLGLPVRKVLDSADAVVVASVAELDPRAGSDAEHIGPMNRAVAARPADPTMLMSLSTFPFKHLVRTWRRLLDAAEGLPARVIATTGPALDPSKLQAPPNVELRAWVDHSELMPEVSAVVTHGGHGTTIAALSHGLPVLVLPLDTASDQPGIGRLVERAGIGIALSRNASVRRIREAAVRLLSDEELRRRASAFGARVREYGGSEAGADALERAADPPNSGKAYLS